MRGRWWHRALCVVFGLWLGMFVTEPMWLHVCPLHSPAAGHVHGAPPSAGESGGHEMSHHQAPAPGGVASVCSCPGPCGVTAVPPLPVATAHALGETLVVTASAARPEHEYVAAWVDFVLPFATAPPHRLV